MTSLAEWAPTLVGGGLSLASAVCLIRIRVAARHARNAVADAVERHFNVLEAVREGVCIVDADLRVTHMNDEAERILDRTAEAGVGFPLENAADPIASALGPDIRAARGSGLPIERTYAFPSLLRWVEVRIMPAADETLISLRDISAQRVAESQLNANSHSLQLVENNVDAVLWTVGRDCRFSAVSGGALAELGLTSGTLIGRSCAALISEELIRDVLTGRHVRAQSVHGEHWLQHHVEPLADRDGEIIGATGVSINITELKRTQRELYDAAHSDRLTSLPNRFSLEQRLQDAVSAAHADDSRFALLFLDLDRFKAINDTLGHGAGDDVLREVALRLQKCMRGADFIARPGGDEFVILLSRIASITDVEFLSRRVIEALSAPIRLQERTVYVGVSVGAAVFPDHGRDAEALTAHADAAMYRAKAAGGGGLAIYDRSLQALDAERFALEADLREAVARDELELEYQPLIDLARNEIVGCEALLRWRHPIRGTISPDVFVPIAEASSSIVEIDRWVLREACAAAAKFREIAPKLSMSVNLSPRDLREDDLSGHVASALLQHGIPPHALVMEVTETAALDESALPALERLRELGVQIAMDDFGIGYSSLAHLKRLPVTTLKIDRTFIRDVTVDESDRAIVVSIVNIAKAFGLRVVAEGIETDEQAAFVRDLGCDDGQGFRLGRPQPPEDFARLLAGGQRPRLRLVERTA
ncbi:MAG TPA: EAL domain-containing protein [Dongiaceae bacterium]|nr:EAL domain-containing protein [Dongiaceae bacterium]